MGELADTRDGYGNPPFCYTKSLVSVRFRALFGIFVASFLCNTPFSIGRHFVLLSDRYFFHSRESLNTVNKDHCTFDVATTTRMQDERGMKFANHDYVTQEKRIDEFWKSCDEVSVLINKCKDNHRHGVLVSMESYCQERGILLGIISHRISKEMATFMLENLKGRKLVRCECLEMFRDYVLSLNVYPDGLSNFAVELYKAVRKYEIEKLEDNSIGSATAIVDSIVPERNLWVVLRKNEQGKYVFDAVSKSLEKKSMSLLSASSESLTTCSISAKRSL